MNSFLYMIDAMIAENGGTIDYRNRGLNSTDLEKLLEKVRYLRGDGNESFYPVDFDVYEIGMIRGMIECWLDDIEKYPPEGEFTIISRGHPVADLLELQRLIK